MYETTYGEKYAATQDLRTRDVAKLIRADIKAAIADGTLPKGLKVSVTTRGSSMHSAIDLYITAAPFTLRNRAFDAWVAANPTLPPSHFAPPEARERYSEQTRAALAVLRKLHAAYNYDGSDYASDYHNVRYYGSVGIHWEAQDA